MRRALATMAATVWVSLLTSCSPTTVLGELQPAAPGGEMRDIAYAPGPRHSLDVYLPANGHAPAPVVVFFYGGTWQHGDRAMYRFVGRSLADCGAITIIPDYRVWPETRFPGFLRDAAAAVAFVRREAPYWGGGTGPVFLAGHSAGAYIAAMIALDPEWLAGEGLELGTAVAGVVGLAGPYDFLPLHDPVLKQIFAPEGPNTQPINFAANARAPLLLLAGENDKTVDPGNSARLAARARDFGGQASLISYPNIEHMSLVAALSPRLRFMAPVRDDICRFVGGIARPMATPAVAR